jgi:hypothetical protein
MVQCDELTGIPNHPLVFLHVPDMTSLRHDDSILLLVLFTIALWRVFRFSCVSLFPGSGLRISFCIVHALRGYSDETSSIDISSPYYTVYHILI